MPKDEHLVEEYDRIRNQLDVPALRSISWVDKDEPPVIKLEHALRDLKAALAADPPEDDGDG